MVGLKSYGVIVTQNYKYFFLNDIIPSFLFFDYIGSILKNFRNISFIRQISKNYKFLYSSKY